MKFEKFRGRDLARVLSQIRALHGEDVLVVRTSGPDRTGTGEYEVVVAGNGQIEQLQVLLQSGRSMNAATTQTRRIALVGPAGAGKTTTIAKLALHANGFGAHQVGLLTLDTYRVAGLEQLQIYADIAGFPLEVAYDAGDLAAALKRLRHCDTVLIDTPGRISENGGDDEWTELLAQAGPTETHLVLPAGLRIDVASSLAHGYARCRPTHVLLSKLDEVPGGAGVAELALALGFPARWITDGPGVPEDLASAARRIFASFGAEATARRVV